MPPTRDEWPTYRSAEEADNCQHDRPQEFSDPLGKYDRYGSQDYSDDASAEEPAYRRVKQYH